MYLYVTQKYLFVKNLTTFLWFDEKTALYNENKTGAIAPLYNKNHLQSIRLAIYIHIFIMF